MKNILEAAKTAQSNALDEAGKDRAIRELEGLADQKGFPINIEALPGGYNVYRGRNKKGRDKRLNKDLIKKDTLDLSHWVETWLQGMTGPARARKEDELRRHASKLAWGDW